ncbi:MAG: hypothetical protein A3I66_12050 [Burkholderiales bacterium RIFCSPLOWO2_02_FULL_57_36]|nr:MAG: hypothetical protein A3I66_12050 [Burkholderiales bacterium RIFCSPLOWO2_02_FULL_57_36]
MLPPTFLDWWFAPWAHASGRTPCLPSAIDQLGRRDGYRLWCAEAGIDPDIPLHFDPAWHIAATADGTEFIATARLFAGLLAARDHDQAVLGALPFADRKWCVSIAATQPLQRCSHVRYDGGESIEVRGMVELARRLEHGFPGLWGRLRLTLPIALADKVDRLRHEAVAMELKLDACATRAQRCWQHCRNRAESMRAAQAASDASRDQSDRYTRADHDDAALAT